MPVWWMPSGRGWPRPGVLFRSQCPLRGWNALNPGVRFDGGAEGPRESLELRFDDVVRVPSGDDVQVQTDSGVQGDSLKHVPCQGTGEVAPDQVVLLPGGFSP